MSKRPAPPKKNGKQGSPRRDLFVKEYLVDLNATQAAIRCGYSKRTANRTGARLMSNAVIKAAVDAALTKRSGKVELTAEWVLERLITNVERSMQAEEGAVANKALELLGKHLKLFTDRVEHSADTDLARLFALGRAHS